MDKQYVVKLTQTGVLAPVATEIRNDLGGTPIWAYVSPGVYTCTLASAFSPAANVVIEDPEDAFTYVVTSTSIITLTATGGDDSLTDTPLVMTVYAATPAVSAHYASQTDIENRISRRTLAQLISDTANSTTPDATVVAFILGIVDAKIDALAGQVYTVPFNPVPEIINRIAIDLACYEVMQRRPVTMGMPAEWQKAYDDAMKQLEAVSNMLVRLPSTATVLSGEADMESNNAVEKINFTDTDPTNQWQVF